MKGPLRRPRHAAQFAPAASTPLEPLGVYDRVHDGLISGWFTCPGCGAPPSLTPDLSIDGQPIGVTKTATPRGDVPGGSGFLMRFSPVGDQAEALRVQCPTHSENGLDLDIPTESWATPALASIEYSGWPILTGWLALLSARDGGVRLHVDGYEPMPVRITLQRSDVQTYLGAAGVGGFRVDLGAILGYALPETTRVRVITDGQVLAEATITDSPLGDDVPGCLPTVSSSRAPLDNDAVRILRRRFRNSKIDIGGDWRDILDRLGQREYSAETEQWAAYLTHHGQSQQETSAWLAIRATHALGVPALNPLPDSLNDVIKLDDESLSGQVRIWTEPILGINDPPDAEFPSSRRPDVQVLDLSDMKVAVAGLVSHKSGVGQSARNSLKALDLAGVHACRAPLFPAPGGWNTRLGPDSDAVRSLEDHTVLLHLPMERVVPALAAQPALLGTDRLIGYFMWELEMIPRQFHRALDMVDEIWTATDFVANALRRVTETPVYVSGHAVDVSRVEHVDRSDLGIPERAFVVHYSFDANSTVARKNPNAALDAFQLAFGNDPNAVFVLKVRNFQQVESLAWQGDPDARGLLRRLRDREALVLVTGEWSYSRSLGLIAMADCYLSLHRSEGYGYGIAEAVALGTPVIASDYSSERMLFNCDLTTPLGVTDVDLKPGEYLFWEAGASWAEPDVSEAAEHLRQLRRRRTEYPFRNGARLENDMHQLAANYVRLLLRPSDVTDSEVEHLGHSCRHQGGLSEEMSWQKQ